jgi:hypothetical protein
MIFYLKDKTFLKFNNLINKTKMLSFKTTNNNNLNEINLIELSKPSQSQQTKTSSIKKTQRM